MILLRGCRHLAVVAVWLAASVAAAGAETLTIRAGDNLQAALDRAQPGDVIMLEAGATFIGNFVLPVKAGASFITVRSSAPDSSLPPDGTRITPAAAALLPKIVSNNSAASLVAAPGAHHWRLQFLEFPPTLLGYGEILRLGDGSSAQSSLSQVPSFIEVDRIYLHGHPLYGQKRGIALNGRSISIRNSHISDIKAIGFDSQAIAGWNGPGPFTIENNFLEAAGENVLFGGADPPIPNLVTENVVVRYNHMSKPLSWRNPVIPSPSGFFTSSSASGGSLAGGTYAYRVVARRPVGGGTVGRSTASAEASVVVPAGATGSARVTWSAVPNATEYRVYGRRPGALTQYFTVSGTSFTDTGATGRSEAAPTTPGDMWTVKNLFELKNARHVTIEYNVFENNWMHGQKGYAILFTPRNQDGGCPWCVVEDVTFQFNVVRNVAAGINLLGFDSPNISARTTGIRIRQNLFYGITQALGGPGWFCLIGDEPRDVIVEHNTIDFDGTTALYAYGGTASVPRTITGFRFLNNALRHSDYGINGASFSTGIPTLTAYFPGALVQGNWLQGGTASRYPSGNSFAGTFASAFVDVAAGDYRPASGGPLMTGSTDGTPIGADIPALMNEIRFVTGPGGLTKPAALTGPNRPAGVRIIR